MSFTIETTLPTPRRANAGTTKYPFDAMPAPRQAEDGSPVVASFFATKVKASSLLASASHWRASNREVAGTWKFKAEDVVDDAQNHVGARIWRVK